MNPNEKKTLKAMYAVLGTYYNAPIPDIVLGMYVEDLEDLPLNAIMSALQKYRRNPKNRVVPLPAIVREMVMPATLSDDQIAVEVAARIITAIAKFGYSNGEEAMKYIGEVGWHVVQKQGGWTRLCENLTTDQIGVFQAQARELAKAQLQLARTGNLFKPPSLPSVAEVEEPDRLKLPTRIGIPDFGNEKDN